MPGVRILYVSPLKALNYDIEKNLREPLAGLAEEARRQGFELPEIRVGVRTGDTRSKERQQMVRRPPHILITTPESLHLILTSQAKSMLRTVQFLILDEIHALCNNKRGVFTSLLLERLEEVVAGRRNVPESSTSTSTCGDPASSLTSSPHHLITSSVVRIGLSATQRPLEEVARYLGGAEWQGERLVPRPVEIVDAGMRKQMSLQVLCPVDDLAHLQAETLWPGITRRLLGLIRDRKSTIVFANNRRQVERLTAQLNEAAREEIALPHHGSIAAPARKLTEERLKQGEVRAVCATGTLELGIDMGAVELVCQVESPRQVSKGLQRVGRAGHLMSAVSEGRILAKQPLDLLEAAVLAREMLAGRVESLRVPQNCLDVLAQQLVAIVADGERSLEELYRLVRRSYCYHDLPEAQFQGTVAMISGRYPSHLFRDLRARVSLDRVRQRLLPLPGTQRAALTNGGTIPDTGQFGVYISTNRVKLGELDEEFIYESRVGDTFSLGIDTWRIDRIEADRVLVSPSPGSPARMPFWRGESYGREPELGRALGEFIAEVEARLDEPELEAWIASQVPVDETGAHNIAAYLRNGREKCGSGASPSSRHWDGACISPCGWRSRP
jgi:ATP-dependent Lhr-like helicase